MDNNKYKGRKTSLPIIQPKYTSKSIWLSCEKVKLSKEWIEIIFGADKSLIPDRYYIRKEKVMSCPIIPKANKKIDVYDVPKDMIEEILPEEGNPPEGPFIKEKPDFYQGPADILINAIDSGDITCSDTEEMKKNIQAFVDKTIDMTVGVYWFTLEYCLNSVCIPCIKKRNFEVASKWLAKAEKWIRDYKRN